MADLEKQHQELETLLEAEKQNGEDERKKLQADFEERLDALQEEITVCRVLPQVGLSQTFPFDPLLHIVPCNIIPTHQSSDQQLDAISTCVKQCGKATKVYTRV